MDIDRDPLEYVLYEEEKEEIEDVPHISLEKANKPVKTIQSFLRGKLSQKKAVKKTVQRAPHRTHKPTPYTRFSLTLQSWKEYQRERKQDLTNYLRNTNVSAPIKQRLDLLVENQVQRFKILQEYEKELEKIGDRYKVTEVSSLKALEAKDFYEHDYLILYNEFVRNMNILEKSKEYFQNDLLRFFSISRRSTTEV